MAQAVIDSGQAFSSVFNSSVPQRPAEKSALRSYGGRPLGPNSYSPTPPGWMFEPERQSSAFASKTVKGVTEAALTADIDYLNKPQLLTQVIGDSPGSRGYTWPRHEHEMILGPGGDGLLDRVYDPDYGGKQTVANGVINSGRKYASSFTSASKRFPAVRQPHEMGPGSYEEPRVAVQVKDAKRSSYAFKSLTTGSTFTKESNEPPDAIQSSQYAEQARHWTSKGLAFSTRERFPRQRPRWKD